MSGTAVTFKLKATGPGNVKVAIYNESAGCPYRKLYSVDTPTAVIEGWNDFSINYPIVGSGYYWLAYNSDSNIIGKYTGSLKSAYRSAAFTGFTFPNVCDPYFSNFYNFVPLISCYGAIPIPPQTAPNLLSPGTSITFKWSAVYGATNYQLQVNTSPDFTGTDIFNAEVNNVTTRELSGFIDGSTYYWRVKAGNPYGWGDWSITRQVTADTVTP